MSREMKVFTFILGVVGVASSLCSVWFFVEREDAIAKYKELQRTLGLENTFLKERFSEAASKVDQLQQQVDSLRQENVQLTQGKLEAVNQLNMAMLVQKELEDKMAKISAEKNELETQVKDRNELEQRLAKADASLQQLEQEKLKLREELQTKQRSAKADSIFEKGLKESVELPPIVVGPELPLLNPTQSGFIPTQSVGMRVSSVDPTIPDGKILSVNEPYQFVVLNLGEKDGVKSGMKFRVMRGDQEIGVVEVIEARPTIAAADIRELHTASFQTDDRVLLSQR